MFIYVVHVSFWKGFRLIHTALLKYSVRPGLCASLDENINSLLLSIAHFWNIGIVESLIWMEMELYLK